MSGANSQLISNLSNLTNLSELSELFLTNSIFGNKYDLICNQIKSIYGDQVNIKCYKTYLNNKF